MRRGNADRNQALIVKALREAGCSVQPLHSVGDGCPDLLVGFAADNFLFEVKDPAQEPNKQRLSPTQKAWHENWRGFVHVVKTPEEAIKITRSCFGH